MVFFWEFCLDRGCEGLIFFHIKQDNVMGANRAIFINFEKQED